MKVKASANTSGVFIFLPTKINFQEDSRRPSAEGQPGGAGRAGQNGNYTETKTKFRGADDRGYFFSSVVVVEAGVVTGGVAGGFAFGWPGWSPFIPSLNSRIP